MDNGREMSYSKWIIAVGIAILTLSSNLESTESRASLSLPGCPEKCGNVTIPYPFGIGYKCSYNSNFSVTCDHTFQPSPKPIDGLNLEVLGIALQDGRIRILNYVSRACYKRSGEQFYHNTPWVMVQKFTISTTSNIFAAIGCDTYAWFSGGQSQDRTYSTGCMTLCNSPKEVNNGTCSGVGCCEIRIPKGVHRITVKASSFSNYTQTPKEFTPCSSAFVVAKGSFNFSLVNLTMSFDHMPRELPVVYDWTIGDETCATAQAKGKCLCCEIHGSECVDSELGGYRCSCLPGHTGNPYLLPGCQDIDECSAENLNDCKEPASCVNTEGSYRCQCPKGFQGMGITHHPCLPLQKNNQIKIILGLSIALGTILLLVGGWWLNLFIRKRNATKQKAKYFKRNGGLLLQQQMSSDKRVVERTRIFTVNEIEEATNHFSADRILGQGGQGTVYKGMLEGGRIVAMKKSKAVDESQGGELINEIVILSQINHRNIVKLLGCCLETEVPLLVYEFIPNGTLFHHIHYPNEEFAITWKMRLQIAIDSASALAYLHYSSSIPIFHRDIKSSNILLDDKYRAKLSDFGTSRSVAIDQTHITTRVFGTFGYLDPEYFQSSQFTEKSDVYSFGVVLIELLTGEKAIRSTTQENKSLISWFLSHMDDSSFLDIVDSQVLQEASEEEMLMIAELAEQCLNLDGKQRPTMQQVLTKIEEVRSLHPGRTNQHDRQKTEQVLTGRTQSIHQSSSNPSTSMSYSESHSVDSAELSLLFNPR